MIKKTAKSLLELGLCPLFLKHQSKVPLEKNWPTKNIPTMSYIDETYQYGMNLGIRLGDPFRGGYLHAFDVDISHADALADIHRTLQSIYPEYELAPTVTSGRGGGSKHVYVLTSRPVKSMTIKRIHRKDKKIGELCIYGSGRQLVLPPSLHPSGSEYEWADPFNTLADLTHVQDAEKLMDGIEQFRDTSKSPSVDIVTATNGELEAALKKIKIDFENDPRMAALVYKSRQELVLLQDVVDRSVAMFGVCADLFRCGFKDSEVAAILSDPQYAMAQAAYDHAGVTLSGGEYARRKAASWVFRYTVLKVAHDIGNKAFDEIHDPENLIKELEATELEESINNAASLVEDDWKTHLKRGGQDGTGRILDTVDNLRTIFQKSFDQKIVVLDTFSDQLSYGYPTPWGNTGEPITEKYIPNMKVWVAQEFGYEPRDAVIWDAIISLANDNRYHPVKVYLESLKWDGEPRIDSWMHDYLPLDPLQPVDYIRELSRIFFIALIKRVYEPGCKYDNVLILEGPQGIGKSRLLKAIVSDEWFTDQYFEIRDKDVVAVLRGKWLSEFGELGVLNKSDVSLLKSFVTRQIDRIRPPYGRLVCDTKRQFVFVGTTNDSAYLSDTTGNRRFFPIKLKKQFIRVEALAEIRDQLFAEALFRYKNGETRIYVTEKVEALAVDQRQNREKPDPVRDSVQSFIVSQAEHVNAIQYLTLFEPMGPLEGMSVLQCSSRAVNALAELGFTRAKTDKGTIYINQYLRTNGICYGGIDNDFVLEYARTMGAKILDTEIGERR